MRAPSHAPPPASREPVRVLKFGGAALADGAGVRRAARIVMQRGGGRIIVVVSAAAGVTALLERTAREAAARVPPAVHTRSQPVRIRHRSLLAQLSLDPELADRHLRDLAGVLFGIEAAGRLDPQQLDFVLSFGERISARILAAQLRAEGAQAAPVDAFDLGLVTDSTHGGARPLPESAELVRRALSAVPGIAVVTGFVARDAAGNLTTLGPNGSDLTAALLAEAVRADSLCYWKAVPGILTADPELVRAALPIEHLSWDAAERLAGAGAAVLHPNAIEPVRRAGIDVSVRDVRDPSAPGTHIGALPSDARGRAVALVARRSQAADGSMELALVLDAVGPAEAPRERLLAAAGPDARVVEGAPPGLAVVALPAAALARAARQAHRAFFESESEAHGAIARSAAPAR